MNFVVSNQKGEIHEMCGFRESSEFSFKTVPIIHFNLKIHVVIFVVVLAVPNAKYIVNETSVENEIITKNRAAFFFMHREVESSIGGAGGVPMVHPEVCSQKVSLNLK